MRSRQTAIETLAAIVTFAVFLAVGCTAAPDDEEPGEDIPAARFLAAGSLTACVDAPKYPFAYQDSAGNWQGSDVDVLKAVAEELDRSLEVVARPFDGIWRDPTAGVCDLAAAAITITDARATEALFSTSYLDASQSLLVRAQDEATFATLASLANHRIGVKAGTTSEAYATEHLPAGATLVPMAETEDLFLALGAHDVDAVLGDLPLNGYRSTLDSTVTLTERFETGERYGIAAALDNPGLIAAVDDALEDYRESNEYARMLARWFGL